MAAEDWLYTDDLDESVSEQHNRLDSVDSIVDGEDLLDDVLTAPPRAHTATPTNDDELLGIKIKDEEQGMEDSGSARFNADQMSRTIQARIESNKMSQGVISNGGTMIYTREPNRKNSIFVGNLTWWTTDLDLIKVIQDSGLKEVKNIKFYENRTNGQSKGYALVELSTEALATSAVEKIQQAVIHDQKPYVMYALRVSPHTFEAKCSAVKSGSSSTAVEPDTASNSGLSISKASSIRPSKPSNPSMTTSVRPPALIPGLGGPLHGIPPPPMPGMRPPGFPGIHTGAGLMAPPLNLPPFGMAGLMPPRFPPPQGLPGLGNLPIRPDMMRPGFGGMGMPPLSMENMNMNMNMKPAGAHLNPAFLHDMAQNGATDPMKNIPPNMMELFTRFRNIAAAQSGMGVGTGGGSVPMSGDSQSHGGARQPIDDDAADANQRNRAISSSAIHRALTYSKSGDFDDAIDTLNLAIGLIRQSLTGNTETSQIIIGTLSDCLRGIEEQASAMSKRSSRHDHRSHDDRERGSRSSHKSKHHRDRSRERRR